MIDKSLPFFSLYLCKNDPQNYPRYDLPEGYTFTFYREGDEKEWVRIELELGQFKDEAEGLKCFEEEFRIGQTLKPEDRMLFVRDPEGKIVATTTLWNGKFLGQEYQRVHWVAVSDECAGKGIAKALLTRVLDLYNQLGYKDFIYLLTATWYYPAIAIYRRFGFAEYRGPKSTSSSLTDEEFCVKCAEAIAAVDEKILSRKNPAR